MLVLLACLICFLSVVNFLTLLFFYADKERAIAGDRRIPESNLLGLALIGGSPAALIGRKLFRHKTKKEPFSTILLIIVALQIGTVIGFTVTLH